MAQNPELKSAVRSDGWWMIGIAILLFVAALFWEELQDEYILFEIIVLGFFGILSLLLPKRPIFLVNAIVLLLLALLNLMGGDIIWLICAILLALWGGYDIYCFISINSKQDD